MNQCEFETFRKFLHTACGIYLGENKQYLVSTRIRGILVENQLPSVASLIEKLACSRQSALREKVIDAMTTNETFWFRDIYPFDHLKKVLLPTLMEKPRSLETAKQGLTSTHSTGLSWRLNHTRQDNRYDRIRIWSAACSSGQEPYSIRMTVEEFYRQSGQASPVELIATDLSSSMIAEAKQGEYNRVSVMRGLTPQRLEQFFDPVNQDFWKVKPKLRNAIDFRLLNLLDSYVNLGKFDIIFCRNVLIYFSASLKQDILRRLHASLKPGGFLFLGSSEGVAGLTDLFSMQYCKPGIVYQALSTGHSEGL